jgi:hypothetical protein
MSKEKRYIHFVVAPYALPSLILAFANAGVTNFAVTMMDNDLAIGVSIEHLESVVYSCQTKMYTYPCMDMTLSEATDKLKASIKVPKEKSIFDIDGFENER